MKWQSKPYFSYANNEKVKQRPQKKPHTTHRNDIHSHQIRWFASSKMRDQHSEQDVHGGEKEDDERTKKCPLADVLSDRRCADHDIWCVVYIEKDKSKYTIFILLTIYSSGP